MSPARLRLVILAVDDMPRAVAFYRAAFSWEVAVDLPGYVEFALTPDSDVSLYQRESFAINTGVTPETVPDGNVIAVAVHTQSDGDAS